MTNEEKIVKWLAGELSDSERNEFERTEEFAKTEKLMKALYHFKAPDYNIDSEYRRLYKNVINKKGTIIFSNRFRPLLKIAAILVLAFAIGFFTFNFIDFDSSNKEWIAGQAEVYLPDSSFVTLNTDSKIRYLDKKWQKERKVELAGEAFFRVKKGSQFNVKTLQGTVTVLGTEFAVKDWGDFYEVACFSGKVKVITPQNQVILEPDMAYRVINGIEEQYTISNQAEPNWLHGESNFKSVPLRFVINELERQYKVSVAVSDVNINYLFTGSFPHDNLKTALESITIPVNIDYIIHGNQIKLTVEDK